MAKTKILYTCSACGAQSPQWAGQCSDCGGWNTLSEVVAITKPASSRFSGYSGDAPVAVQRLSAIKTDQQLRTSVGMQELDRVLGGGLVAGSVVLIGGDCPVLNPGHLKQALTWLASGEDAVLGPAEDGGYVLLGLNRVAPALFNTIEWGGEDVLAVTRARLAGLGWKWRELKTLWDLDRPQDLDRYYGCNC